MRILHFFFVLFICLIEIEKTDKASALMFSCKSEGKMDAKPRSRANTVIGQIKWWTSSNQPFHTNNNTPATNNNNHIKSFGSSVAVQKLRESKWFGPDESRIFCAVIECGFIVETREGQENDGWFGVVNCKTSKGKGTIFFDRFQCGNA